MAVTYLWLVCDWPRVFCADLESCLVQRNREQGTVSPVKAPDMLILDQHRQITHDSGLVCGLLFYLVHLALLIGFISLHDERDCFCVFFRFFINLLCNLHHSSAKSSSEPEMYCKLNVNVSWNKCSHVVWESYFALIYGYICFAICYRSICLSVRFKFSIKLIVVPTCKLKELWF